MSEKACTLKKRKTMNHVYFGILAGGSGERLWPLSKKNRPKQLLPFLENKSLLQHTIERINLVTDFKENIFVVTNQEQKTLIEQDVQDSIGFVLAEPCGRNTAPAILWAAQTIYNKDPRATIVFLTADHFVPEPEKFNYVISKAVNYIAHHNKIAIFGLTPTYAATGYGYIQASLAEKKNGKGWYPVKAFHEKPHQELAFKYLSEDDMFWNMGVFAGQASTFISEFEKHAPDVFNTMEKFMKEEGSYSDVPKISVDYAIMEKSNNTIIFPADFEWYDVGNIHTFLKLQKKYKTQQKETILEIDASNNFIKTNKKIVACIGIKNLCIVETKDTLLITRNDKVEEVKKILGKVKEKNIQEAL